MKRHLCCLLMLVVPAMRCLALVDETPAEFTSTADFNGDGFLDAAIVDKSSGLYRIGYGTAGEGPLDWAAARPTGVAQLNAVTLGQFGGGGASIVVGSSASNRVQLVSPTGTGYVEPVHVGWYRTPNGLAAMNLGWSGSDPADELAVIDAYGNGNACFFQLNPAANGFEQLDGDVVEGLKPEQVNAVRHNRNAFPMLAMMSPYENQIEGGFETRAIFLLYKLYGVPVYSPVQTLERYGLEPGTCYTAGNFDSDETDVFFYLPGRQGLMSQRIHEAGNGVLSFGLETEFETAHPVRQVVVLPGTPSRLAVLLETGDVRVVNFNGAAQTWISDPLVHPAAGAGTKGLIALHAGRFLTLSGEGNESTSVEEFKRDAGGNWNSQGITTLPKVNRHEVYANVLLMHDHPFRYDGVFTGRTYRSRDWSSGASITSGSISADSAFFGSSSAGLGTASAQTIGSTSASDLVAVPNQLHTQISMFTLSREIGRVVEMGEVSPPSGTYTKGFRPSYDGPGKFSFRVVGSEEGFERVGGENGITLPWVEREMEIEYYVEHDYGGGISPVKKVSYSFSVAPAQVDTDGDGVPDFVEVAQGTDPTSIDSDNDGLTDLEEFAGRVSHNRMEVRAAATLLNLDGDIIDRAAEATPAVVSTLDGSDLATAGIGSVEGAPFFAFIQVPGVSAAEHLLTVRTAESFTLRTGTPQDRRGREFLGIVPALEPVAWSFNSTDEADGTTFLWGGTNWLWGSQNWSYANQEVSYFSGAWSELQTQYSWGTAEAVWSAADWVSAYLGHMQYRSPFVEITLSPDTTLQALLVEEILHHLLLERAAFSAARHFSVTPGRASERTTKQANVSLDDITALEHPDPAHPTARVVRSRFVLDHVNAAMAAPNEAMEKLIKLARDLYRLGQQPVGADPTQFANPLDVLRTFIRTGTLPADYAAALSVPPAGRAEAFAEIAALIAAVPVRTPQTFTLRIPQVVNVPHGMSLLESTDGSTAFFPLDAQNRMLRLGESRQPGTPVTLTAYLDMPSIGGFQSLEVVSATLDTTPIVVAEDSDDDLLADSWELAHFGTLSHDGSAKPISSQYSLAQEYLEGTDPTDNSDNPLTAPIVLELDKLEIQFTPQGQPFLKVEWPERYDDFVEVVFQFSANLQTFTTFGTAALNQPGVFKRSFNMSGSHGFFRPLVRLKR